MLLLLRFMLVNLLLTNAHLFSASVVTLVCHAFKVHKRERERERGVKVMYVE